MHKRLKLAAYLAHVRRADGSWPSDWTFARLAINEARQVLQHHLTDVRLPHALTIKAYAASEDIRASEPFATEWPPLQAQVVRVVPVVQRLLRTLAGFRDAA
ncbi:MAG: hypothetical protein EOO56_00795 [Hymenobacter sp.]|nr:MAG: hypothetical protein EOO56_00795 [Hymenobacter sp.]